MRKQQTKQRSQAEGGDKIIEIGIEIGTEEGPQAAVAAPCSVRISREVGAGS